MAGVRISGLPVIPVAPALTDIFPEVQPATGGTTYKTTFQQLLTLYQTSATNWTGLTGVLKAPTAIQDANSKNIVSFLSSASAVNYISITNSATNMQPLISAAGTDANIALNLSGVGTAGIQMFGPTTNNVLTLIPQSSSQNFGASFSIPAITAARTYTFPDASGTVAFLSSIGANVSSFIASTAGHSNVTGDGTAYTVIFETINEQIGSSYNASTGQYTAAQTGYYFFSTQMGLNGLLSSHTGCNVAINNTTSGKSIQIFYLNPFACSNAGGLVGSTGGLLFATAGDVISITAAVSNGTKVVGIPNQMSFSGNYVVA